jgi:hypothetical protein
VLTHLSSSSGTPSSNLGEQPANSLPAKVLRRTGLAGSDWDESASVKALFAAAQKYFPRSVPSDSDPDIDADADADDYAAVASDSDDSD